MHLHACSLQNITLQAETWSCTRAWTSIYDSNKSLLFKKLEKKEWTLVGQTVPHPLQFQILDTHWVHTGIHLPVKRTLCSPECFPCFSLAHLCAWTSIITFIHTSGTKGHSEVYKICLVCCGQSPLFFMPSHWETQGMDFIVGIYLWKHDFSFNWPGRWYLLTGRMGQSPSPKIS